MFGADGAEAEGAEGESGGVAVGGWGDGFSRGIDKACGIGVEVAFDEERAPEFSTGLALGGFDDKARGPRGLGDALDADMDGVAIGAGGEARVDMGVRFFEAVIASQLVLIPKGGEEGVKAPQGGRGAEACADVGAHGGDGGEVLGDEGDVADFRSGNEGFIFVKTVGDLFESVIEVDGASDDHALAATGAAPEADGSAEFIAFAVSATCAIGLIGVEGAEFDGLHDGSEAGIATDIGEGGDLLIEVNFS